MFLFDSLYENNENMPCPNCTGLLIYFDDGYIRCPKCDGLAVLDSKTAINVATRIVELATKVFEEELSTWERDTLLGNLAAKRELFSRQFFRKHGVLDVGKLTDFRLLIKLAAEFGSFTGKIPHQPDEINKLVETFESLRCFESSVLNVRAGFMTILYQKKFNENSFTLQDAIETFVIVKNEMFLNIERIFANHQVFPHGKAEEEFARLNPTERNETKSIDYELLPPQDFIQKHYQILAPIFALFHHDRSSAECFKLNYLEQILIEPRNLIEFVSTFKHFEDDTLTFSPTHVFVKRASTYFGVSKHEAKKLLVFEVNNKSICPIFVRFRNKTAGDVVCITKDFSRFIYTILHPILTRELFDNETNRLSKEFEKQVQAEFERNEHIYRPNITDKRSSTLEIDGLAIKNKKCYIVECKAARLKRLMDEPDTTENIIRDLKGYVLGKKYTTNKDGQMTEIDKPSMAKKIAFVRDSINALGVKYGFDTNIEDFKGVIITMDYPPIPDYNGTHILSIGQISNLV
jgi:hypothetical protein